MRDTRVPMRRSEPPEDGLEQHECGGMTMAIIGATITPRELHGCLNYAASLIENISAQCRAAVGGSPSSPIATMMRSHISAPSS
jgi:hypothetical protein